MGKTKLSLPEQFFLNRADIMKCPGPEGKGIVSPESLVPLPLSSPALPGQDSGPTPARAGPDATRLPASLTFSDFVKFQVTSKTREKPSIQLPKS